MRKKKFDHPNTIDLENDDNELDRVGVFKETINIEGC